MKRVILMFCLVGLIANMSVAGKADKSDKEPEKKSTAEKKEVTMDTTKTGDSTKSANTTIAKEPESITTELGVKYQDLIVGKGQECKTGTTLFCHYTLWGADSTGKKGKVFDSSKDRGQPFKCTLGTGLISGWSDGMVGMKEGGTRRLLIKPELGYGKAGIGPIPGNQWLVFEIDFLEVIK